MSRRTPFSCLLAVLSLLLAFASPAARAADKAPATPAPVAPAPLAPAPLAPPAGDPTGPVAAWKKGVRLAPVSAVADRHSIHSYYVANPESPDGRHVVFFTSRHAAGYVGEVRIVERATGKETVLAENVHVEDAHRAACQQWLAGGRLVAWHEVIDKKWRVVVIDVQTLQKTVVADDRQVGFGRPEHDLLPMYGCHWNPGPYRDLYVWDARKGQTRTALAISDVERQHGDWLKQEFQGKPTSLFFPVLSPDGRRVFLKIAAGAGGDVYMAKGASKRQGIVAADLDSGRLRWFRTKWGHPGWHPDSQHIFEVGHLLFDIDAASDKYSRLAGVPNLRGTHPSVSPDGRLLVTDGMSESVGGKPGEWCVLVGDMRGGDWTVVHSFDHTQGAKSWRRNDPHPAFSADGKRIYYNVGDGPFTRLWVAERP